MDDILSLNDITYNCYKCSKTFNSEDHRLIHQQKCKIRLKKNKKAYIIKLKTDNAKLITDKAKLITQISKLSLIPIYSFKPRDIFDIGFLYMCHPPANVFNYIKVGRSSNMYDICTTKGRLTDYHKKTRWFFICKVNDYKTTESSMIKYINLLRYRLVAGKETFECSDINKFINQIFAFLQDIDVIIESKCNYLGKLPISRKEVINLFDNDDKVIENSN